MKVPYKTEPFAVKAVRDSVAYRSSHQLEFARATACVATRLCGSRMCWSWPNPLRAPIARITDHTSDAQFQIGIIMSSAAANYAPFEIPWLHQAGQKYIVAEATLVSQLKMSLAFRFSSDDWLTVASVAQTYSEGYAMGVPWEKIQHDQWDYVAGRHSKLDVFPHAEQPRSILLKALLKDPDVPNATTDRTVKLEFFVKPGTDIAAGWFDYDGTNYVYMSDLRIYDIPDMREV